MSGLRGSRIQQFSMNSWSNNEYSSNLNARKGTHGYPNAVGVRKGEDSERASIPQGSIQLGKKEKTVPDGVKVLSKTVSTEADSVKALSMKLNSDLQQAGMVTTSADM